MADIHLFDRSQGCLLGLAVGDALGAAIEFRPKDSFAPIKDMMGGGIFNLKKGQWTDDTSMALCLADSLIAQQGFDPQDQMQRYYRWYQLGENSVTGKCFGMGKTVLQALTLFKYVGAYAGSDNPKSSGNGSLMRLAPVPIFYHHDLSCAVKYSILSSKTTHGSPECLSACAYFGEILWHALHGETNKDTLLTPTSNYAFSPNIQTIIDGSFKQKARDDIFGTGYVVNSLEAALWCFYHTDNFKDAVLQAANLGDDADTTAAITGQIAGAYYGLADMPQDWVHNVAWHEYILQIANKLLTKNPQE
ncbi:ADP-ribosylglycohydrolase family protein [Moraxella sp. VT-16-12]|uniref:ADP-ribosylglycohydrolase family protein n=1 Tax=Moraxella sp. VT-16-12 TaxID=2014877 RepID=UPI001C947882|nr:ADP-ribosylglycohydrolase family protein [Moraxella sp. VT-16-12]